MNRAELGTEIDWQRVSPKYLTVDLVGNIVTGLVLAAVVSVPFFISQNLLLTALPAAVVTLFIPIVALTPRRVRAIGYALRDDDLLVRRGIAFTRFVAVPYGRMQLIDINRGPIMRALGLSEVKFVTAAASSGVTIPGLPADEADELRDRLVALAETRRAGL